MYLFLLRLLTPAFFIYTFLFFINVLAFFCYAGDRHRVVYSKRRIPAALLIIMVVFGGAYGAGCSMLLFGHRTIHTAFKILVPVFFLLWTALVLLLVLI